MFLIEDKSKNVQAVEKIKTQNAVCVNMEDLFVYIIFQTH